MTGYAYIQCLITSVYTLLSLGVPVCVSTVLVIVRILAKFSSCFCGTRPEFAPLVCRPLGQFICIIMHDTPHRPDTHTHTPDEKMRYVFDVISMEFFSFNIIKILLLMHAGGACGSAPDKGGSSCSQTQQKHCPKSWLNIIKIC